MAAKEAVLKLVLKVLGGRASKEEVKELTAQFGKLETGVGRLKAAGAELFAGWGIREIISALLDAGVQAQALDSAFTAVMGSAEAADAELGFIRRSADKLGQQFVATTDGVKNFYAAALSANYGLDQTRAAFLAVSEAAAVLKTPAEDVREIFRAMSQIVSGGVAQTVNLRDQIGDRLPGAMVRLAKEMGYADDEFKELLGSGKLLAKDVIPALTKVLHEQYGPQAIAAAGGAAGAMNRYANAWYDLKSAIAKSGFLDAATGVIRKVTGFISGLAILVKENKKEIAKWAKSAADRAIEAFKAISLGAAVLWDIVSPIIDDIGRVLNGLWDRFQRLPAWAQKIGIVGAILAGKNKIFLALSLAVTELSKSIEEAIEGHHLNKEGLLDTIFGNEDDYKKKIALINKSLREGLSAAEHKAFLDELVADRDKIQKELEATREEKKAGGYDSEPMVAPAGWRSEQAKYNDRIAGLEYWVRTLDTYIEQAEALEKSMARGSGGAAGKGVAGDLWARIAGAEGMRGKLAEYWKAIEGRVAGKSEETDSGGVDWEKLFATLTGGSGGAGTGDGVKARKIAEDKISAALETTKKKVELEIVKIKQLYDQGKKSLGEYYDKRTELMTKRQKDEVAAFQSLAKAVEGTETAYKAQAELEQLLMDHEKERIELEEDRRRAEEDVVTNVANRRDEKLEAQHSARALLTDIKDAGGDIAISADYQAELDQFEQEWDRKRAELDKYLDKYATLEEKLGALDKLRAAREAALKSLLLEQDRKMWTERAEMASEYAGTLSSIFSDIYELSDKKDKAAFQAAKAAAAAEIVLNTQKGIMDIWGDGELNTYAKAAWIALVTAQGAVSLAKVQAQSLAGGGLVGGSSPNKRADNIPANLTAGEYVHQVDAVDYYGRETMGRINRREIPRELLEIAEADFGGGGLVPSPEVPVEEPFIHRYADGGYVEPQAPPQAADTRPVEVTNVNVLDPSEIHNAMGSQRGQAVVLNIMSRNAARIRRILDNKK